MITVRSPGKVPEREIPRNGSKLLKQRMWERYPGIMSRGTGRGSCFVWSTSRLVGLHTYNYAITALKTEYEDVCQDL